MKTLTMIAAALAATITFATTFEAEAARTKHPAPPQAGHLAPDNNGHYSWTSDAQGRPRAQRQAASHKTAAKLASLGATGASAPLHGAAKAYGAGTVVSHKTGATARVGSAYAPTFQAYVDELEAGGATVRFMGGIRPGHCWSGGMHPCGKALDVCQLRRGVVDARCHLPGRQAMAAIAERHGLFEGGRWCRSDYGHAQVGVSAAACGETITASGRHHIRTAHK